MSAERSPMIASMQCDSHLVHCPICGQPTEDESDITPCKHLVFVYYCTTNTFLYHSDEFLERSSNLAIDGNFYNTMEKILNSCGYGESLLVMDMVMYEGFCNGSNWGTVLYGFDYEKIAD